MATKYLNNIFEDNKDKILGDIPIYEEDDSEIDENQEYTVTIIQPTDAVIEVTVNGTTRYTSTFTAKYDDTYTVGWLNGSNPSGLILNAIMGKVARNITIRSYGAADSDKHVTYRVTIVQSANQIIRVSCNGKIRTESFIASKYDYYTSTIEAVEGYIAGTINNPKGVIMSDITISASNATKDESFVDINITQSANQTITVVKSGNKYTKSFAVAPNTPYSTSIVAAAGYRAGAIIDTGNGLALEDVYISAFPATKASFIISIRQSAHQTIQVTHNGSVYTEDFAPVYYGDVVTAKVIPDEGYNAGKVNASRYTATDNFLFEADPAIIKMQKVKIPATTNQTITFKYTIPGQSEVTVTSTKSVQELTLPYFTTWTASVVAEEGYNAGTLSQTSGTVKGDVIISVSGAQIKRFTVKAQQSANQTITLTRKDTNKTTTSQWTDVPWGTTVTATIAASTGYNPGTLNATSRVIKADYTFSAATSATYKIYTLTLKATTNQTIVLTYTRPGKSAVTIRSGSADKTVSVEHFTVLESVMEAHPPYTTGKVSASGNSTVTGNVTVSATAPKYVTYTMTIKGTTNQTITFKYKNPGQSAWTTITSTTADKKITIEYGASWTATVTPINNKWEAGKLNLTSGTMNGNTTISATAAKRIIFSVKATQYNTQTITLTRSDTNKTSTVGWDDVPLNATVTATIEGKYSYEPGTLNNKKYKVINDYTFTATSAKLLTMTTKCVGTGNYTFNIPIGVTKVAVSYTWHYRGDERPRLTDFANISQKPSGSGSTYSDDDYYYDPYSRCEMIYNKDNGKFWWRKSYLVTHNVPGTSLTDNPTCFVSVTPGKKYILRNIRGDGYGGRDYGFYISWGEEINAVTYSTISDK